MTTSSSRACTGCARRIWPASSAVGMRTRKLRAALSALGIAIGVAAIVAVLGLSSSSQAGLLDEISQLGTNLLTVANGQTLSGDTAELPLAAPGMISRIGPVTAVDDTGSRRQRQRLPQPADPRDQHQRAVRAGHQPATAPHRRHLGGPGPLSSTPATAREPVAVLGATAAGRLGIDRIYPGERIWLVGPGERAMVLPRRHPPPRRARPRNRLRRAHRLPRRARSTSASTGTPPRSTCARTPTRSTPSTTCSPPPPTPNTPTRSPSPSPPTRWSPEPTPKAR